MQSCQQVHIRRLLVAETKRQIFKFFLFTEKFTVNI